MHFNRKNKTYSFSVRDLGVMRQVKASFNEIAKISPKHPGLPPLWSRLPYLMLLHEAQTTTKYFWKEYRKFDELLKSSDSHYRRSYIPKNNGGSRELLVPDWDLRHHQRFIQKSILYKIPVSEHACAYHKHRGLTDLARPHIGHDILIHIDIKDFFSNITEQMVFDALLEETGCPKIVAGYLSRLCCYKHHLPQGACTSPALSNICLKGCDDELAALAISNHLAYTRYSDDIYLSGNSVDTSHIIMEAKNILSRHGFCINGSKTKVLRKNQAQMVTAIVVNEKMQVSRAYRRKLRQEIYYLKRFKETAKDACAAEDYQSYLSQLLGRIAFVLHVDPNNQEFLEANRLIHSMLADYWNNYMHM